MNILPHDPGSLPSLPAPLAGEVVDIDVNGYPPFKDLTSSIRNQNHPQHSDFKKLRIAAIKAMAGRAWYFGPVELDPTLYAPCLPSHRTLHDYIDATAQEMVPDTTVVPTVREIPTAKAQAAPARRGF